MGSSGGFSASSNQRQSYTAPFGHRWPEPLSTTIDVSPGDDDMAKKTAAPTQQPQATISKMAAIEQLLANGIESPSEIVAQATGAADVVKLHKEYD